MKQNSTPIDTRYPDDDGNNVYNLAHFLMVLNNPAFMKVTKETVNQKVRYSETLLDLVVQRGMDYFDAARELLVLGATISFNTLDLCHYTRTFHLLLHYGGYMFVRNSNNFALWENYNSSVYEHRWTLLLEYGVNVDIWWKPDIAKIFYPTRDRIRMRMNNCRKALLTLIWMTKQSGYTSLKLLFVGLAKWIWSLQPYTNDLHPSIGPRSPIWDLIN